jgi:hypothetical protein
MANEFVAFTAAARANLVDYQIGVTSMRPFLTQGWLMHPGVNPSEYFDGPVAHRVVTRSTLPSPSVVFARNVAFQGYVENWGGHPDAGLEATYLALSAPNLFDRNAGFHRRDARLSVLLATDRDDESAGAVDRYLDHLWALKAFERHRVSVSALTGGANGCSGPGGIATPAPRSVEAARRGAGVTASVCGTDWADTLQTIGDRMFGPPLRYPLTATPDPATLEVRIDGAVVPPTTPEGTRFWSYRNGGVEMTPLAPQIAGSTVRVAYAVACD